MAEDDGPKTEPDPELICDHCGNPVDPDKPHVRSITGELLHAHCAEEIESGGGDA